MKCSKYLLQNYKAFFRVIFRLCVSTVEKGGDIVTSTL